MYHVIIKIRPEFQEQHGRKSYSEKHNSRVHACNVALEETKWESTQSVLVLDMNYGGLVVLAQKGDFA